MDGAYQGFMNLLLYAAIGYFIYKYFKNRKDRERALNLALECYERSLEQLKKDPTNAELKQKTLTLGRNYSAMTRDSKSVTIFDEMALSNDISAACAGASATVAPSRIEERLAKLEELKSKNLITTEEYKSQRQRLLGQM